MGDQDRHFRKNNVIPFPSRGIPLDYCLNSSDTKHEFKPVEYDPEVKRCIWCGLLIIPGAGDQINYADKKSS